MPGSGQTGVFTLRDQKDSAAILDATNGSKKVVVIGASFIGMEVAAFLRKNKNLEVTVVGMEKVPFERVLGCDSCRFIFRRKINFCLALS